MPLLLMYFPGLQSLAFGVTSVSARVTPRLTLRLTPHHQIHLQSKIIVRRRSEGVLHQRLSSMKTSSVKGRLPSKVVFRQGSSSVKGYLQSKVVSYPRLSFDNGHLLSKIVFRQRSSSVNSRLPSMVVFRQRAIYS